MRIRTLFAVAVLSALTALPALAHFGGGDKPPAEPSGTGSTTNETGSIASSRQQAERWYADAYDDVAKAKKDIEDGKAKNAEKKFKRALERGQRAVELDSTYHEAWNLVGYSARKLGDYPQALAAYGRCLTLKPDFAAAREYLGEAYLELKDVTRAREQLAWLEKQGSSEAKDLKAQIDAFVAAHPDTSAKNAQ